MYWCIYSDTVSKKYYTWNLRFVLDKYNYLWSDRPVIKIFSLEMQLLGKIDLFRIHKYIFRVW